MKPKKYTVEANKSISDTVLIDSEGNYSYSLHGPNGFVREWSGNYNNNTQYLASNIQYIPENQSVQIHVGMCSLVEPCDKPMFRIVDNVYNSGGPWETNSSKEFIMNLSSSGNWYDFTVTSNCYPGEFLTRYMGRMETGHDSISDPAMANHVVENDVHPLLPEYITNQPNWWETYWWET